MFQLFDRYYLLRVVAGEHDLKTTSSSEQVRMVKKINVHPDYRAEGLRNDIAILEVRSLRQQPAPPRATDLKSLFYS